ncbi:MAG: DinB family protein [bacterium]|nr:DinB family protein [bacterium]
MSNPLLEIGLAALKFAREVTLGFLDDIPEDKLCYCPIPEGNHAFWLIGHIAITDDVFRCTLGGKTSKRPELWSKLFGRGSKPLPDAGAYPSPTELRAQLQGTREELLGWFQSLPDPKLTEALPEEFQRFAPNYATLMTTIAWHEGMHAGQLRMIGRSLGNPPKFG